MARAKITGLRRHIGALLRRRGVSAERVVIFGSAARGTMRADSDIDVAIVSPMFRRKTLRQRLVLTAGLHRELIALYDRPFDILYYSDKEWRTRRPLLLAG